MLPPRRQPTCLTHPKSMSLPHSPQRLPPRRRRCRASPFRTLSGAAQATPSHPLAAWSGGVVGPLRLWVRGLLPSTRRMLGEAATLWVLFLSGSTPPTRAATEAKVSSGCHLTTQPTFPGETVSSSPSARIWRGRLG